MSTALTSNANSSPSNKSQSSINNVQQQQQQQQQADNNNVTKHWSQKKHESSISSQSIEKSKFLSKLRGGSDSGQFIYLDASLVTANSNLPIDSSMGQLLDSNSVVHMASGKLLPGEIVLEIQGKRISGYTLYDVVSWLKQLAKSYQTITFRTVKSSSYVGLSNNANNINVSTSSNSSCSSTQSQSKLLLLPYELRQYLDERFQKGSIDYDLQQIIRENVYMRTVPCTTRLPRQGEIHGQDYIFLTNDEFLEMEQSGDLLEYGVYNGHYYGTPKPPKQPKASQQKQQAQQPQQQQSLTDMTSMLNLKRNNSADESDLNEQLNGNTEISNTTAHQLFNHNTNNDSEIIPYGWEKVEDPEYGTFYIDHINKQTTYENPFMQQQLLSSSMKTFKPNANNSTTNLNLNFKAQYATNNNNNNTNQNNNLEDQNEEKLTTSTSQMQLTYNTNNRRNIFFTQNPNELKGEFFKTALLKTLHGFGFTIIGANETSEDFLQIKFVVPDGAADRDGCLRQGDVLVYVNNECVLGYTHQDVVEIFQSIPVGNTVELTVCRGYPLSIDPNDPNIEMVPLAAINNPNRPTPAPLASADELTASSMNNSQLHLQKNNDQDGQDNDYYCEEYEEMFAAIVKGPNGFGFTIADDAQMNHQKVKQILDRDRCVNLLENDILLEINGVQLRNYSHNEVVDVLKECEKGKETIIKLKRRKYSISMPAKSSTANLNSQTNGYSPSTQSNTSNKVNGTQGQSPNENNDFRPISSLSKTNSQVFNTQNFQQSQRESAIQNKFNGMSSSVNPNQVAFNYERRSKTPNILQSNNQLNGYNSKSTMPVSTSATTNGYTNQPQQQQQQNGQYQPQLRSKTPTTDRLLFQHTLPNTNQFETPQNNNNNNNDYIYLNNTNNVPVNNNNNGTIKKAQNQHNRLDTLYSTVNKSTRTPVIDECDFIEKKDNIENIAPISHNNLKEHMPIYDSTTNIQHQRVIQNLNRFNHHQQQVQHQQQQQQQQQQAENLALRSKTPGPDICYFRENNNTINSQKYFNQHNGYQKPNNNFNTSTQVNLRSKTPTAEMMYYPSNENRNNSLLRRGNTSHAINANFDNIYQPFGNNNNEVNSFSDFNMDEINLKNTSGGVGQNQITSDVDGNTYVEMVIDLYRQESGFGFRIVGGEEEGSQVAVGYIVQGGSAHVDARLRPSDEIIMIDNECVLGSTHRRVVQLMTIAGLNRKVKLMIRRKLNNSTQQVSSGSSISSQPNQQQRFMPNNSSGRNKQLSINPINTNAPTYPYNVTLFRNGAEGFGFVIISTINKNGPSIGKIVENSPAERSKRLSVGDRILAVNTINISHMNHIEIVKLIKESGNSITLTIGHPLNSTPQQQQQEENTSNFFMHNDNFNGYQNGQSKSNLVDFASSNITLTNNSRLGGRQYSSPQQQQTTKAIINQNEYHVIELRKQHQGGFGFSIRGGKEFHIPLFVLKLAEQGSALLDGRLQIGDQILEINSCDAYQMTHNEAIERIKAGGNMVTLLIRRTGLPPPSITDIIAANATAAVNNAQQQQHTTNSSSSSLIPSNSSNNLNNSDLLLQQQQQQQQQNLRAKSPFLQHQVQYNDNQMMMNQHAQQFKNFNSSSSLMNRHN